MGFCNWEVAIMNKKIWRILLIFIIIFTRISEDALDLPEFNFAISAELGIIRMKLYKG